MTWTGDTGFSPTYFVLVNEKELFWSPLGFSLLVPYHLRAFWGWEFVLPVEPFLTANESK